MRTPVEFSYISSRYNLKRKHPVLNKIRAHTGVDYAAPTVTPVRATSSGTVSFIGNKGGDGKLIEIIGIGFNLPKINLLHFWFNNILKLLS